MFFADPLRVLTRSRLGRSFLACVVALALIATGCSTRADVAGEIRRPPPAVLAYRDGLKLGFAVQSDSRAFSKAMIAGAQEAAERAGVELMISNADGSASRQRDGIQELIDNGVDGVILSPVDSKQAEDIAQLLADEQIPLLAVSNQIGSLRDYGAQYVYPGTVGLIANDDLNMGRIAAGFVDGPVGANIAILEGNPSAANSNLRLAGFTSTLDALGVEYTTVARLTGHWERDGAEPACEKLAEMPEIDLIFSMSDEMTASCVVHFQSVRRSDVQFVSIGGSIQGLTLLTIGLVLGTVCQAPRSMGRQSVQTLVRAFRTGDYDQGLAISAANEVTRKSLDDCQDGW